MRTYVIATGSIFALLTAAHIWRMVWEDHSLATDPLYLAITIIAAALGVWAWRLLRNRPPG